MKWINRLNSFLTLLNNFVIVDFPTRVFKIIIINTQVPVVSHLSHDNIVKNHRRSNKLFFLALNTIQLKNHLNKIRIENRPSWIIFAVDHPINDELNPIVSALVSKTPHQVKISTITSA